MLPQIGPKYTSCNVNDNSESYDNNRNGDSTKQ